MFLTGWAQKVDSDIVDLLTRFIYTSLAHRPVEYVKKDSILAHSEVFKCLIRLSAHEIVNIVLLLCFCFCFF